MCVHTNIINMLSLFPSCCPFTFTLYWLWPEGPIKKHQPYRPNGNVSYTHTYTLNHPHTHIYCSSNNSCLQNFVEICTFLQKNKKKTTLDQLIADLSKHVFLHVHSNESLAVPQHIITANTSASKHFNSFSYNWCFISACIVRCVSSSTKM